MATAVGIDIGLSGIKIAVVDGSGRKIRVRNFVSHRLKDETTGMLTEAELIELLVDLFKKYKLPSDTVVTCIPAQAARLRQLTSTFTREDQIGKTLKVLVEAELHAVSIDDVLVDFYKYGEGGGNSKLLVAVVENDAVERQLDFYDRCGIDPIAIDLDVAAIFNTFTLTEDFQEEGNTLVVDLGAGSVKIIVLENGNLRMVRSMRTRLPDSVKSLKSKSPTALPGGKTEDDFSIEELEGPLLGGGASSSKKSGDSIVRGGAAAAKAARSGKTGRLPLVILDDDETEVLDLMDSSIGEEVRGNILNKILLEIDRTLASVQLADSIEQIVLTGGGSNLDGITDLFEDHFEIPTKRFEPSRSLNHRLGAKEAEAMDRVGTTALGLALKGVGYDAAGMDFRQGPYQYAGTFEKVKKSVACLVCLVFIFFFLLAYRYQIQERRWARLGRRLVESQRQVHYVLFPDRKPPTDRVDVSLRKERNKMNQELGDISGMPQPVSVLDMLREFANGVRLSGRQVELRQVVLSQRNCSIDLFAPDAETGSQIYAQLKDAKTFVMNPPRVQKDRRSDRYTLKFQFKPRTVEN